MKVKGKKVFGTISTACAIIFTLVTHWRIKEGKNHFHVFPLCEEHP
jgi:hypothetical protein